MCPLCAPSTNLSAWAEWCLWVGATESAQMVASASRGLATTVLSVAAALLQGGDLWALTSLPVPR